MINTIMTAVGFGLKAATTFGNTTMLTNLITKAGVIPEGASTVTKVCCGISTAGLAGHLSKRETEYFIDEATDLLSTTSKLKSKKSEERAKIKEEREKLKQQELELKEFRKKIETELEEFRKEQAKKKK